LVWVQIYLIISVKVFVAVARRLWQGALKWFIIAVAASGSSWQVSAREWVEVTRLVDLVEMLEALSSEAGCSLGSLGILGGVGLAEVLLGDVWSTEVDALGQRTGTLFLFLGACALVVWTVIVKGISLVVILVLGLGSGLLLLLLGSSDCSISSWAGFWAAKLIMRARANSTLADWCQLFAWAIVVCHGNGRDRGEEKADNRWFHYGRKDYVAQKGSFPLICASPVPPFSRPERRLVYASL
jgi:hypothetical protein